MRVLARLQDRMPGRAQVGALAPGIALAVGVALAALGLEPLLRGLFRTALGVNFGLPAIVIALVLGIALHRYVLASHFQAGIGWCVKTLLRFAVGLLGLRIALADIAGLGLGTALLVMAAMAGTLALSVALARRLGCTDGYGALCGAANAVCGASATLAVSAVLPDYKRRDADVIFTVVMANAVSTIVMVAYPPLCLALGLSPRQTGVLLGATIHDMAQVVGAGYAVSEPAGDSAVIVKMFRVLLLAPVVVAIGWWFRRGRGAEGARQGSILAGVPGFALAFVALCLVNSLALALPGIRPMYLPLKQLLAHVSGWGLLLAIAALGLGTSLDALLKVDWRPLAVFLAATLAILALATAGILAMG